MDTVIIENRKARFNYTLQDQYTAGLVLTGPQTKAIHASKITISEAFCSIQNNEIFLLNVVIDGQTFNNIKLLLKKKEIKKIAEEVKLQRVTVVPLNIIQKNRRFKCTIALARGKKAHDKRETIKERDLKRTEKWP